MKKLHTRLVLFVTVLLAILALLLSWLALRDFERDLPPEMERSVSAVVYSASAVLETAARHGVPFTEMVGVAEFFATIRQSNPDISYMVITDNDDKVLYENGYAGLPQREDLMPVLVRHGDALRTLRAGQYFNTSAPLVLQQRRVGTIHLGQPTSFGEKKLKEIRYDVLTVLLVASLIAVEVLRFALALTVATPLAVLHEFLQRVRAGDFTRYLPFDHVGGIGQLNAHFNAVIERVNAQFYRWQKAPGQLLAGFTFHAPGERQSLSMSAIDHIRWPFFLLIFADSLSLSFFPAFVGEFYSADMGVPKSLVIGLPISIFMFMWALSMPWAGSWSSHVGHRKAFLTGAAITTVGLILTASTQTLYDLLLWRSITAVGYGLVFITAQGYVAENTPPKQRTKGMAMFLSSFFAGSLSGSAMGGILADRLGYNVTILLSALLSAAAAMFVFRFLQANKTISAARKKFRMADLQLLLRHKQFVVITFLAAVPAKIALTGFLYYSVPMYLKLQGNDQSTIGRVMMAYGLAIILFSPSIAKLADRLGKLRWFVSFGGYAAGVSMLVIWYLDNTTGLLISISLLGLAHAIGVSPQLALINELCKDIVQEVGAGATTGIFRLMERIGNVLGPVIAGILIAQFGFRGAFLGIGALCLVCISCFTLLFFWFERQISPTLGST
ncbi:MFS transporter [Massilia sp. TSP1-1-2]|uniref:MFS transporter n=1 Tax=unclassified Massilia TaxID=2609279 RepID=UPI003CEF081C